MRGKIKDLLANKVKSEQDYILEEEQQQQELVKEVPAKGLKINNAKSQVKAPPPPIDIKQNAYKILNDQEEQKKIAFELTSRLLGLFKDKTLDENKDSRMREEEMKVLSDFTEFARLINTSPNEEDSLGSVSFIIALARCMLLQRDAINELSREVFLLNKQLEKQKISQ